jgi:hypothetical protein
MSKILGVGASALMAAVLAGATGPRRCGAGCTWLLACPVDSATAVRFFYNPPPGSYFHFPLILRAVPAGDLRLNTSSPRPEGTVAYVSSEDMTRLLRGLAATNLTWHVSNATQPLGSFKRLITLPPEMQILVASSKGTAWTFVDPARICATLAPLDPAITTPRGLWEFQGLRVDDGCTVEGFKAGAYPGSD